MTLEELKKLKKDPALPFPIISITKKWGQIVINNKIAIPIKKYASYYKTNSDISIYDTTGNEVGMLCFTQTLGKIRSTELTEKQFIAFLFEADISSKDDEYVFLNNYIIIEDGFYQEYIKKHKMSAPLWGGFSHPNSNLNTDGYSKNIPSIHISNLNLQPKIFLENSVRAIYEPYGFERYLKLYHLLELRFDVDVINRIKSLDIDTDSEKIGEVLSGYSTKEVARLDDIIQKNCFDLTPIVAKLNCINIYGPIATDLLFKFGAGKDNNPFKKQEDKFAAVLPNGFSQANLTSNSVNYNSDYRIFILELVRHIIYRVRCSIAHNKIGEYILTLDQESFVVEFAEPLLKEILLQCFKKNP